MEKNGQMLVFILYGTLGMTKTKKFPQFIGIVIRLPQICTFCQQDTNCAQKNTSLCAKKKNDSRMSICGHQIAICVHNMLN